LSAFSLSEKALNESARVIREMFGREYYDGPRRYQTRVKNAQEAHEAIRPTDFRLAPRDLERHLESDELRLYELVWKRTMASQMTDARVLKTTVEITAEGPGGEACVFSASGKAIEFAGFRRACVEGSDDPDAELADQESILPAMREGHRVGAADAAGGASGGAELALKGLEAKGHETQPPARFTEAALIRELEQAGIGRPSTYATTIATIERRGYAFRQGKALVPTFPAFAVTNLLRDHFGDYVDVGFTAEMEEDLDQISNGERDPVAFIRAFYREGESGHPGLEPMVAKAEPNIEYPAIEIGADPVTGEPLRVRVGRFGPFVQRGEGGPGNTATLPRHLPPADLTVEKALALIKTKAEGPKSLGADPATGQQVYVQHGRFGHYVQLGENPPRVKGKAAEKPKRASLPGGVSASAVTLDEALRLLSLPRELGAHPEDGEIVVAAIGRFGPYVKHGDEFRSLEDTDDVYTVSIERALELLKAPKKSRRRTATKTVLRSLGAHPQTGGEVKLMEGRYGPYVTDGQVNASVPKGSDPASLTLESAVALLKARAEAGPVKRRSAARFGNRGKRSAGK